MFISQLFESKLTENAEELNIGDPVIIIGKVQFQGKTGEIAEFGKDKRFVIVDLYNYGRHSFHSSDVEFNDYADSEEEANDWQEREFNEESTGSYYAEDLAQQVFKVAPGLNASGIAEEVLDYGFDLAVHDLGLKRARYMFAYDEDFASDFVSAYAQLQDGQQDVTEVSPELKQRYLDKAYPAHGDYNMARRQTTGKEQEHYARKEKNTKAGIKRAVGEQGVAEGNDIPGYSDWFNARQKKKDTKAANRKNAKDAQTAKIDSYRKSQNQGVAEGWGAEKQQRDLEASNARWAPYVEKYKNDPVMSDYFKFHRIYGGNTPEQAEQKALADAKAGKKLPDFWTNPKPTGGYKLA